MSKESRVSCLSKKDIAVTLAISAPVAVLAAREISSYRRRREDQHLATEDYHGIVQLLEDSRNSGDSGIAFTKESQKL